MPDGRVVSAGDDYNGAGGPGTGTVNDTAQIYSPPYLFKTDNTAAPRPAITDAPSFVAWGDTFHVATSSTNIAKAVLMAPGATTHANDMSQRTVPLAIQQEAGGVRLTAPPNADVALPGYYMLFLVDANGVPSDSRWISLSSGPVPLRTPPVWTTPSGAPAPGVLKQAPVPSKRDVIGPSISFKRSGLNARRGLISGRVGDAGGVKSMKVALARKGKRCRWWSRRRTRFAKRTSCRRPAWITAKLKRKGASFVWTVRLHHHIPRGHYIVSLRAVDKHGNVSARTGGDSARVSVR
jgi:hypothetical protein